MDAKAFYSDHYRPEAAALVIVGDFQTARMKAKVQEYFTGWQAKGKPPRTSWNRCLSSISPGPACQ
jgi:predicted Zn-dependent peptidase